MFENFDVIFVEDLCLEASIGVHDFEKQQSQKIILNIEAYINANKAYIRDDIAQTLNYEELVGIAENAAKLKHYDLVETLAEEICHSIKGLSYPINKLVITVKKPDIFPQAKSVGIKIVRNF